MPKMKTCRGAAKRFKQTAKGQFRFRRGLRNHILTKKGHKSKRHKRVNGVIHPSDRRAIARLLCV